jgi:hypothetical protein
MGGNFMANELVSHEIIENRIFLIRGQKVMLDRDLAKLYGVETKQLKRAVRRNMDRFPDDFMFTLNKDEMEVLGCQFGTPVQHLFGGYHAFAFTEQGIAMLSTILNSKRAIYVNIQIMRAFVHLRQMIAGNKELAHKIDLLEKRVFKHDSDIRELVRDIRRLSLPKPGLRNKVGFLK